jgi:hypothetical protein
MNEEQLAGQYDREVFGTRLSVSDFNDYEP